MKIAIISGGSSGIGKATAYQLIANKYKVYEFSRSGKNENGILHVNCDVSDEYAVNKAVEYVLRENNNQIDLLINNAGFGISGAIEFTQTEEVKKLFDVNFLGAVRLTKACLPYLRESKGRIINVSSVGAIFGLPFQSFYSATKFALNGYTLALSSEVKRFGVSVCAIMPGDASTNFTNARQKNNIGNDLYKGSINKSVSMMENDEKSGMTATKIGKRISKIAKKRKIKPMYVIGFKYKIFSVLSKMLPIKFVNYIVRKIYAK